MQERKLPIADHVESHLQPGSAENKPVCKERGKTQGSTPAASPCCLCPLSAANCCNLSKLLRSKVRKSFWWLLPLFLKKQNKPGFFTDRCGQCFGQVECSTEGEEVIYLQAWLICSVVGVCSHGRLGQIQKHLTHAHSCKHSVKTYASIQTSKHDLSPVHNYASPILDLTDMQIQIEEENMQE